MKRLAALVFAAVIVLAAVLLSRSLFDWDDGAASDGGPPDGDALDVVCATEFAAACAALGDDPSLGGVAAFRVEAPGTTSAALRDDLPGFDLWITSTPWPELTAIRNPQEERRIRQVGEPLAQSPLGGVHRAGSDVGCPGPLDGRCLLAGGSAPPARLGVRGSTETAGLLARAALTTGWFDDRDLDRIAVEDDLDFGSAFGTAAEVGKVVPDPIRTVITQRGLFDLALDLNVAAQLEGAADGASFRHAEFSTPLLARAVLVGRPGDRGTDAARRLGRERVADAIIRTGWQEPDDAPDHLPAAGVIDYVAKQWSER